METPEHSHSQQAPKTASYGLSMGIAIGLPLGLVIGLLTDNLALWLCTGFAVGLGLGMAYDEMQKRKSAPAARVKVVDGATYALTERARPASDQPSLYWLGDNGQELELTDEEAAELQ